MSFNSDKCRSCYGKTFLKKDLKENCQQIFLLYQQRQAKWHKQNLYEYNLICLSFSHHLPLKNVLSSKTCVHITETVNDFFISVPSIPSLFRSLLLCHYISSMLYTFTLFFPVTITNPRFSSENLHLENNNHLHSST